MKAGKEGCRKCELFHPALCYGSLNEKKCTKTECSYIHLPGTVRTGEKSPTGGEKKACPRDGASGKKEVDCIMCPRIFNSEQELNHHMNTAHSHKCGLCRAEFSYRQDLVDHHCQVHGKAAGGPPAGSTNNHFLVDKTQEVEGQKELLQSINSMAEMMKQSQVHNQNMMALISQLVQQKQPQPQMMPGGWRMAGQ